RRRVAHERLCALIVAVAGRSLPARASRMASKARERSQSPRGVPERSQWPGGGARTKPTTLAEARQRSHSCQNGSRWASSRSARTKPRDRDRRGGRRAAREITERTHWADFWLEFLIFKEVAPQGRRTFRRSMLGPTSTIGCRIGHRESA